MEKKILVILALSGMMSNFSFAGEITPADSGFNGFNFKEAKEEARLGGWYSFGAGGDRFPLYRTPKAQATEKQTLGFFNTHGELIFNLKNNSIQIGLGSNANKCAKANFQEKRIHLHSYLQTNYGVTPQQVQVKLKMKLPEVRAATLVRFDCPEIVWPREFVILRTKEKIEKEGLEYTTPILLAYKGVLFIGLPRRPIEGGRPVPQGIRVGG